MRGKEEKATELINALCADSKDGKMDYRSVMSSLLANIAVSVGSIADSLAEINARARGDEE